MSIPVSSAVPPAASRAGSGPARYLRTAWISDLHLGFRGSRATELLAFLDGLECETLYLVGDVIDLWSLGRTSYWPAGHQAVVDRIIRLARSGARVIYVPGNHDERCRRLAGECLLGVEVHGEVVHHTADGRRFWVVHGDAFDPALQGGPVGRWLGHCGYDLLLRSNHWLNRLRALAGMPYWSLAAHVKDRVAGARRYIEGFEHLVATEATRRGYDGVVCGHIHQARIRRLAGVEYVNDGDWVESCTAAVEDHAGRIHLLRWPAPGFAALPPVAGVARDAA